MNNNQLANVKYPTDIQDASTKGYVDTSIEDLNVSQYTPLTQFNDLSSIVITNSFDIASIKSVTQKSQKSKTNSMATLGEKTNNLKLRTVIDYIVV